MNHRHQPLHTLTMTFSFVTQQRDIVYFNFTTRFELTYFSCSPFPCGFPLNALNTCRLASGSTSSIFTKLLFGSMSIEAPRWQTVGRTFWPWSNENCFCIWNRRYLSPALVPALVHDFCWRNICDRVHDISYKYFSRLKSKRTKLKNSENRTSATKKPNVALLKWKFHLLMHVQWPFANWIECKRNGGDFFYATYGNDGDLL